MKHLYRNRFSTFAWQMKGNIKDITDQYTTEWIRPHLPWVFHQVLDYIVDIDFSGDDNHETEEKYVDYFEMYDNRLRDEIPDWKKLKASKKYLQRKK